MKKYCVGIFYNWEFRNLFYFNYYKDALKKFVSLKEETFEEGTIISIYNMHTDERKMFHKF